ncbi:MAG: DUF4870 domain-containing protein [Leptolyngbya sp. SIO1E4]|nr:DUF4870 domain-containing protein [Leptolyngbya sp. SIO1E4]
MNSDPDESARQLSARYHVYSLVCILLVGLLLSTIFPFREGIENFFEWGSVLAFTTFLSPYLEAFVALLCWRKSRDSHPFVKENSRKLLNFQISSALYSTVLINFLYLLARAASQPSYLGGWMVLAFFILLAPLILIFRVTTLVAGGLAARHGQILKHPFSIPFFH